MLVLVTLICSVWNLLWGKIKIVLKECHWNTRYCDCVVLFSLLCLELFSSCAIFQRRRSCLCSLYRGLIILEFSMILIMNDRSSCHMFCYFIHDYLLYTTHTIIHRHTYIYISFVNRYTHLFDLIQCGWGCASVCKCNV